MDPFSLDHIFPSRSPYFGDIRSCPQRQPHASLHLARAVAPAAATLRLAPAVALALRLSGANGQTPRLSPPAPHGSPRSQMAFLLLSFPRVVKEPAFTAYTVVRVISRDYRSR